MSNSVSRASKSTLSTVVDLLVEQTIKIDALEHILKETNPLLHEFYLGTIEKLRAQKQAEVKQALTQMPESQSAES